MLKVHVRIGECPYGFKNVKDKCLCDSHLQNSFNSIECVIETGLITIKEQGWFSYFGGYLRIHHNCPLNYCSIKVNGTPPTNPDALCDYNHGGFLCGQCISNYSVVLGSWKCIKCSHVSSYNFIWLTVVMALAGVVLVIFLLLVKMTVSSGTTNGLIFYANILSFSGLLDYQASPIHPMLRIFLSWINLDFGIEACFYSGMDVYQKSWLQFVFPFYVWFLVGTIILFCHYSSTVMKLMGLRNIEVLATLFLLSYSKLLKTIVTALSYTDILVASADNVSDTLTPQRVWVYDANINYFSRKHLPLFVVALVFLILLFLPYTILLTFGQCLRSLPRRKRTQWIHSTAIATITDAYQAPYTKHHRYWTGLGLLIRCCLFTIFGTSYNVHKNLFWISLAVILVLAIRLSVYSPVYRKKMTSILEVLHFVNLGALSVALQYGNFCIVTTLSTAFSLVLFLFTLIYHISCQVRESSVTYIKLIGKMQHLILRTKLKPCKTSENVVLASKSEDHPSTTCIELREELIELTLLTFM